MSINSVSQEADAKLSSDLDARSSNKDFFLGSGREDNREIEYLFSDPVMFSPSGFVKRNKPPTFVSERAKLKMDIVQPG